MAANKWQKPEIKMLSPPRWKPENVADFPRPDRPALYAQKSGKKPDGGHLVTLRLKQHACIVPKNWQSGKLPCSMLH